MYDATAKIPSGLLNGNINQFGDFDECVGIEGSDGIQGQYCLAYLQLAVDESRLDLKHLHRLVHSHYAFRSNITDVSTYIVRVVAVSSKPQKRCFFALMLTLPSNIVAFTFKDKNVGGNRFNCRLRTTDLYFPLTYFM